MFKNLVNWFGYVHPFHENSKLPENVKFLVNTLEAMLQNSNRKPELELHVQNDDKKYCPVTFIAVLGVEMFG